MPGRAGAGANPWRGVVRAAVLLGGLALACSGDDPDEPRKPAAASVLQTPEDLADEGRSVALRQGMPVPEALRRRPRIKPDPDEGFRALPDGDLREWTAPGLRWSTASRRLASARGWSGPKDLGARLAFRSYQAGLSLALEVTDDKNLPPSFEAAFDRSDYLEIKLNPKSTRTLKPHVARLLGFEARVGSQRQLVQIRKPRGTWYQGSLSVTGVLTPNGWRLEARVPLVALAPLPDPVVERLAYQMTLFDADEEGQLAEATLRFEGEAVLKPPMRVPDAVRRRGSVRLCLAAWPDALWGYWNGWRCAVPFEQPSTPEQDHAPTSVVDLAFSRVPEPPRFIWLRERLLFVNLPGVERSLAAIFDEEKSITSVMRLGVVSAEDPGNPFSRESGAEPLKLPDGTWAVSVIHAYPHSPGPLGGRCAGTHRVYLSILALQRCFTETPHKPAPKPDPPPELKEIFRAVLEDCTATVANDWTISRDRSRIRLTSSLVPSRPAQEFVYTNGLFVPR